jgi:DNA-directed RNA polymerase subunit M/transcription elongation factor TFIIS
MNLNLKSILNKEIKKHISNTRTENETLRKSSLDIRHNARSNTLRFHILNELLVLVCTNAITLNDAIARIRNGEVGWLAPECKPFQIEEEIKEQFLENPFTVDEGVLECNKCGSRKTMSYQLQDRSGDEGTSTYGKCFQCGASWRHTN